MDYSTGYFDWRNGIFPPSFLQSGLHPFADIELLNRLPSGELLPVRHDLLWVDLDTGMGEAVFRNNNAAMFNDDGDGVRTYGVFFPGNLIVKVGDNERDE